MKNLLFAAFVYTLFSLPQGLSAADPGPIESVMPAASELGAGWQRDTDLIIEDISNPPKLSPNVEGAAMANQAIALGLPLFRAAKVIGLGNFAYNFESSAGFTSLDTNISRFKSEADVKTHWATKVPKDGKPYPVGDEGVLQDTQGIKVLYFRTGNYNVKIMALGDDAKLEHLAKLIAAKIQKAAK